MLGKTLSYLQLSSIYYIFLYSFFSYICDFIFFMLAIFAINTILPSYQLKQNKTKLAVLLFFSLIPFYAASFIVSLFPSLFFVGVISIYSLYIYYLGIVHFLQIPKKDVTIFFIISSLIVVGIYLILHFLIIYPFFDLLF